MNSYPASYTLVQGDLVSVNNRQGVIVEILDFESASVRDYETGQINKIQISELKPYPVGPLDIPHLDGVSEERLQIAKERLGYIKPLLFIPQRTRKMVTDRAAEIGIHTNTLYKLIRRYEDSRLLTSLVPGLRKDKGTTKLSDDVEKIIRETIESEYLTRQKKNPAKVFREVKRRCHESGFKPPHPNTVRNRLKKIPAYLKTAKRHGHQAAKEAYSPHKGTFPGADYPLAVVQIDHTPLDIILVDDIYRQPIGRPWITLAVDVFSRMVVGYHVSFDPPSALSTGLCLAHAILPKEKWLTKQEIDGDWPCYGLPKTIHVDNAKEFRGVMLQRACDQYGIDIEWRPVGRPEFGGHVERLLGTFADEIKALPGATFSNVQERGNYKSEKKAALSFSEFERWLATLIIQAYHHKSHSSLTTSPLEKYKEGVLGSDTQPGVGLPARIMDEDRLRLDFMPFIDRSVQNYGVLIDNIHYWADALHRWVNVADEENTKLKRKFTFRRDPRDISTVWFFDPELQTYFPIPYRDTSHPPISIWEFREAKRRAKEAGRTSSVDERQIFEAYTRMRELEEEAKGKTAAVRRANKRREMGVKAAAKRLLKPPNEPVPPDTDDDLDDLQPFDVMEEM